MKSRPVGPVARKRPVPTNSPYLRQPASVQLVMLKVMLALIPGIGVYIHFFGWAIVVQIAIASTTALIAESAMVAARGRPVRQYLSDGSALVTAWLIALSLPSIVPWWMTVLAVLIAIVIAKHLYGGLGQNPFNPAMVAFATMIVAYPQFMSQWPSAGTADFAVQWQAIFGDRQLDAMVMATPLDTLRTALHTPGAEATVASVLANKTTYGMFGGRGWEWVALAYLLGGLWLIQQKVITWHIPAAFIAVFGAIAALTHWYDPTQFAGAGFHLFSGGAMLGAFFIATDPVSASTTPKGKLIFAGSIALIDWIIRVYGAYPDGIAFSTLLMNLCVPLIDMHTQPKVFGHKGKQPKTQQAEGKQP